MPLIYWLLAKVGFVLHESRRWYSVARILLLACCGTNPIVGFLLYKSYWRQPVSQRPASQPASQPPSQPASQQASQSAASQQASQPASQLSSQPSCGLGSGLGHAGACEGKYSVADRRIIVSFQQKLLRFVSILHAVALAEIEDSNSNEVSLHQSSQDFLGFCFCFSVFSV